MMWINHGSVGLVLYSSLCIQFGFAFEGRFTDLPSNLTVKEGQNIEMACAFQSGTASVYLEIQWWFIKAPEEVNDSEEEEEAGEEMEMIPDPDPDDEGTKISTVKVQGNDISHKLQISRVGKSDEGLYECRVTNANYGELLEYKAQAYLKVNATAHPRRLPPKKTSPLHLTADKKPRKPSGALGGHDGMSSDQRLGATSSSHTASSVKHNTGSGTRIAACSSLTLLLLASVLAWDTLL